MSLRDWFLTPAPTERRTRPEAPVARESAPTPRDAGTPHDSTAGWAPPINAAPAHAAPAHAAPAHAAPAHAASAHAASAHAASAHAAPARAAPARAAPAHAAPARAAPADDSPTRDVAPSIASVAVIGRPGETEPVAAGIALALRGRAAAAAVIVVAEHAAPSGDGGIPAARRLAARLDAHGFPVAARGRLAWVYAEPDDALRAVRVAGPGVLAITVPLDAALELAISDTDLTVVVTRDEHGPLAQMATASLAAHDVTVTTPLPRGLPRLLARCGLRAPAELRNALRS